ncbi:RNA polymerase sigma factor [Haliscomenobacter sp.]|uniref:RNA polymerase sigma factor n=1 Tax=Haliscomenobacter sp. TaxID=2717303 RepID=UPI0035935C9E
MLYVSEMNTHELVLGLQDKSEKAFSTLYDAYASSLLGITYKIVNNKPASEEILQDVFVKIWKHIHTYDIAKGSLFTWMVNITRNTCKDYFRSKHYHYETLITPVELAHIPSKFIPTATSHEEISIDLDLLMQKLEPRYKDILHLVYIYGYSQVQVSEKLNLPLGTVKTRSNAALKRLRYIYTL